MQPSSETCFSLQGDPAERTARLAETASAWSRLPFVITMARGRSLALLLRTVQLLPYLPDPVGTDRVCSPESIVRRGADCTGKSVLFGALARAAGYDARIRWEPQPGADQDHCTVEVWIDNAWRWADPTVPDARIGESPWDAARRTRSPVGVTR